MPATVLLFSQVNRFMIPKMLFSLLVVFVLAGCAGAAFGKCEAFIDPSLADREFISDGSKLQLSLEASETELPSSRRPVAVFLIPDGLVPVNSYRLELFQEKIDAQSEPGRLVLAAIRDQGDVSGAGCRIQDDLTVSGCTVVMGTMNGRIGNCCAVYPLAYEAAITLPGLTEVQAPVFGAIAILDEDIRGRVGCVQIISP
jgi:hypothetical protein